MLGYCIYTSYLSIADLLRYVADAESVCCGVWILAHQSLFAELSPNSITPTLVWSGDAV